MELREFIAMLKKHDAETMVYFTTDEPGGDSDGLELKGVFENYDYDDDGKPSTGFIELALQQRK